MKADFEGLVAPDDFDAIPDGYAGLIWSNFGVIGRDYVGENFSLAVDGYDNAMRGDALAYTGDSANTTKAVLTASGANFTLVSGIFAVAWNTGQTVKFTAFRDGEKVGHLRTTIGQDAQAIAFNDGFKDIDAVKIVGFGGTDANADDNVGGGMGAHIVMDNLRLEFDDAAHVPAPHERDSAFQFGIAHSQDWAFAM